jgi:hypothetical protein
VTVSDSPVWDVVSPDVTSKVPPVGDEGANEDPSRRTALLIGSIMGGIVLIVVVLVLIFLRCKLKRKKSANAQEIETEFQEEGTASVLGNNDGDGLGAGPLHRPDLFDAGFEFDAGIFENDNQELWVD